METTTESINSAAKTNGITLGIISAVIGILTFYVQPSMMGSISYGIGVSLISLGIYVFFTLDLRKKIGGYWSFKEALRGIFLMALVSGLLVTAVNFVFYKFIEPDAYEKISGFVASSMTSTYSKMGMSQDQIDDAMVKVNQSLKSQFNPGPLDVLKNFGMLALVAFILSLIFAAIFKRNAPVFAPIEEE